ncbi:MAG TPA: DNA-binding domain-containing protein [Steroidobacteraceae bacterium]|nr:DNA-binding domain-containing protein [Steroidobacteraceae bacterium]
MKLAQLQESFQDHVLRADASIEQQVLGDQRFPTALRLGVYSGAYALRLIEVLAESFPAVQAALGASRFAALVSDFTREHPSRFRSARAYGEQLASWLASRLSGPRATGIADLARFEWAVAGAFDAADQRALVAADLAAVAPAQWPQLQFEFSPTLRCVNLTSNAVAWWRYACADQGRPSRWRATCLQRWLVWRRDLAVFYRRQSQAEARMLEAALAGRRFGELCEQLDGPARAASLLHGWVSEGLVSAARVRSATEA